MTLYALIVDSQRIAVDVEEYGLELGACPACGGQRVVVEWSATVNNVVTDYVGAGCPGCKVVHEWGGVVRLDLTAYLNRWRRSDEI